MRISVNKISSIFTGIQENYYWLLLLVYLSSVFYIAVPIGVLCTAFMLLTYVALPNKFRLYKNEVWVIIYILYNMASVINYLNNDMPISLFFTAVAYSIIPIIFYFYANRSQNDGQLDKFMMAIFASLIVAIILYIWAPSFYGEFLVKQSYISRPDKAWIRSSLQGLYGITTLGTFSSCCVLYYYWKTVDKFSVLNVIRVLFSAVILVGTGRRSAIAGTIVLLFVENIIIYMNQRKSRIKLFGVIGTVSAIFIIVFILNYGEIIAFLGRNFGLSEAIAERSDNWISNVQEASNSILFGGGLGTKSHMAHFFGYLSVNDNSYLKLIFETGIIGAIPFFVAIILGLINAMRKKEKDYIAILIVLLFLVQAIGSNVWEFQQMTPLFWLSLGMCAKKDPINKKEIE